MNPRYEPSRREMAVERSPQGEPSAKSSLRELATLQHIEPQPMRWAVFGAASAGVAGAVVGLIIGLCVYAPTAPFAMVELGLPAAIVGGVVGLLIGSLLAVGRRVSRKRPHVHDSCQTGSTR